MRSLFLDAQKPGLNLIFGYISNSVKNHPSIWAQIIWPYKEVQKWPENQAQYTQLQEEQAVSEA